MNKTGKYLFLLLALCLLLALLPVTAFATGTTEVSTWEGLQAALSAGGDIVLTGDVTPENPYQADALTVPSGVTAALDLNGHRVDRGYGNDTEPGWDGSVLIISGTLTVNDSDPEMRGAITGGFPDQYGGGVQIQGGTFNLLGGSITGNRAGKTGFFGTEGLGGGVYMQSGTFNMSGGSISGNKALGSSMGSSLGRGGGVYITGGTFNFTGGTISGNDAGAIGGGVYLASTYSGHDGKIYVSGDATVTDNTVGSADSNVYLEEGGILAVTGALTGTIGVTMQAPGVFTSGWKDQMGETADPAEYFTSDDAGLVVSLTDAGEAKLGVEEYPLWVGGVQATSANKGDVLGDGTNVTYNPETQTLTFPENITLTGADSNVVIYAVGQDLTIQAPNGLTLNNRDAIYGISTGSKALTVETGGVLAITVKDYGIDAGSGGVTVTGNVNITVGQQGIMTDGPVTVTGDVTIRSGGTYGIDARGKVELNGNIDIEANGFCILTNGDIALDYGTCTLTSSSRYDIHGNNITLEGTSLTGVTQSSYDCVLANQKLTLVRGDFSFTGGRRAIQANGDIEIQSGVTRVYGKCTSTSDSVICAYNNGEIKLADSLRIVTPEDGYIDNTNYSKIVDKNGNNVTEVVIELITYPLWVGGVQVTGANKGDILNDGGTASYDPDSNTLTLNNANITGMYQGHPLNRSIRTEDMDLTVALTGSNTVSGRIALAVYGDLTITGGGSLTTTGSASEVIYAKGNLTIDGCDIEATAAENYAIFCCGDLTITDSNVTAASEAACAFSSSGGSLTISGDSRLFAQATDSAIKLNNGFDIGEGLGVTTPTDGYVDGNFIKDSDGNTAKSVVIERLSTYSVTVTPGANMTLTSGAASQTVTAGGAMESVVYTADEDYYFPEDYTVDSVNGVAVTRDSFTQITVSGTPTWNAAITLTAPMAKTKPDAPTAAAEDCTTSDNNDGKLTGVTTAMEYKKSDAENWTAGAGSDIENLVPGTYYVRVKATDTTLASDNQELEIKEFISYTVTFKVVNGSWNEGKGDAATADKTVTLTGHDGDSLKLEANQIPAVGDKPNGTYKAGSWDVTPSAETEITAATTYTYTYAAKETATVTKAPAAKTLTYNGSAQELVTAGTATGGEMQYALGTATEATQPYTTSIPTETDAGTYYVWYKVVGDETHDSTDPVPVTVVIAPKTVALTAVSSTVAYTGAEQAVSGFTASVEGLTFAETVMASGKGTDVGAYDVTFSGVKLNETKDSTGNYVVTTTTAGNLTINKANSAVKTAPTAVSGLVYTGKAQTLVTAGSGEGGTIQYAVTADETEPADEDYEYTNESLPTGTDVKTYYVWYRVFGDANHNNTAAAHFAVRIKEADAGNTAPEADKLTYKGEAQPLVKPGSATGGTLEYALGDSGDTAPESGWSEKVPQGTDAGTYHVWYRVLGDANHNDVAPACMDVEIGKQPIAPTVSITGWTYGQSANAPSVTGNTGGGAVTYAYSDKADGTFAEAVPTNEGTWYVKATVAETANYLGATTDAASFAIARATATVTANPASKTAGDNDPPLTATVTGLVNGDKESVITYTVTRAAGENAGTYAITPKGETAQGNYAVTYIEGTLTITAKPEPQLVQDEGDYSFEVEEKPGAPKVEVEKLPEADTNKLMTEEEKQLKEAGASVNVTVETTPLSEGSVPEGDKNLIALTAKDMDGNVIVGMYIDISMYLKVGDGAPRQVTELNGATLKLRIEIPKELLNGQYTDFAIIQTHDGKTQIHSKRVGDAIELELTELCTFALVYKEVKAEPEPEPQPEPEPEPLPEGLVLAKLASTGKTSLKLTWTKLKGAEGYDVYFSACSNSGVIRDLKLKGTVKAGKALKYAFKGLKKGICYKACVKAWVMRDGKKVYVSQSPVVHSLTNNQSTNTTNAKSVKLNKSKLTLTVGGKAKLKMTVKGAVKGKSLVDHGDKYRYYSSDKSVATVKQDGTVKAVGAGTCEIYAIAANGEKAGCKVTVSPAPQGVSFKKQGYEVKKGKTLNLAKQLKLNPTNAKTTYAWKSSDKRIAKVNSKGEVKGVKKGAVTITVKTANGKKASVTVTVK